jgi:hypothetical protein
MDVGLIASWSDDVSGWKAGRPRIRRVYVTQVWQAATKEVFSSLISFRLTFTWAKPLLDLGRAPVQVSAADLPALGETTTALTLQAGLQRVVESTKQPLWRSLYRAHRHLFLWQWVLTVIMSVLTFGPQVCVYYILRLLEQEGSKTPYASLVWIWAAALGAASLTLQVLGPRYVNTAI